VTTNSEGYVAKQVLEEIKRVRPELFDRIKTCKGTRVGMTMQQRVLQVTLDDGQYLQTPFLPKGTGYGAVVGNLVDALRGWRIRP